MRCITSHALFPAIKSHIVLPGFCWLAGLEDSKLEMHHIVVNSWDRPGGVCAEQNVVLVSIASGGRASEVDMQVQGS